MLFPFTIAMLIDNRPATDADILDAMDLSTPVRHVLRLVDTPAAPGRNRRPATTPIRFYPLAESRPLNWIRLF